MDTIRAEKAGRLDSTGNFTVDKEAMKRKLQIDQRKVDLERFYELKGKSWYGFTPEDLRLVTRLHWERAEALAMRWGVISACVVALFYIFGNPATNLNLFGIEQIAVKYKLLFAITDIVTTGLFVTSGLLVLYWSGIRVSHIEHVGIVGVCWILSFIATVVLLIIMLLQSASMFQGFVHIDYFYTLLPLSIVAWSRNMFFSYKEIRWPYEVINVMTQNIKELKGQITRYLTANDVLEQKEDK